MHELVELILEKYEEQGLSNAEAIALNGLPASTWRRLKNGEGVTLDTVDKAGKPFGITARSAFMMLSPEAKTEAINQGLLAPNSEGCANACPARREMNGNLKLITELYEKRIEGHREVIAEKNEQIKRFRIAAYILLALFALSVAFVFYLIFIDFANPAWGIFQYPTALWEKWQDVVPQAFGL